MLLIHRASCFRDLFFASLVKFLHLLSQAVLGEHPVGSKTRLAAISDALNRLSDEGMSGEGLEIRDEASGAAATVVLIAGHLILQLTPASRSLVESSYAPNLIAGLTSAADGVSLLLPVNARDGAWQAWPVELVILSLGAESDYRATVTRLESPEQALNTPEGSVVSGTGTYYFTNISFTAVVRAFEQGTPPTDKADWNVLNATSGLLLSSGSKEFESPRLIDSTRSARLLAIGAPTGGVTGTEISPLWLHPASAQSLRVQQATNLRVALPQPGLASSWQEVTLSNFETGIQEVTVDGGPVLVGTVTGRDASLKYAVTLPLQGTSRLALAVQTPVSSSAVLEIRTSRSLRLRGRVFGVVCVFVSGGGGRRKVL